MLLPHRKLAFVNSFVKMWEWVITQRNLCALNLITNSGFFLIETNYHWGSTVNVEEDNMGDTAITFIILFLLTLLFSIGTTAFKVQKQSFMFV